MTYNTVRYDQLKKVLALFLAISIVAMIVPDTVLDSESETQLSVSPYDDDNEPTEFDKPESEIKADVPDVKLPDEDAEVDVTPEENPVVEVQPPDNGDENGEETVGTIPDVEGEERNDEPTEPAEHLGDTDEKAEDEIPRQEESNKTSEISEYVPQYEHSIIFKHNGNVLYELNLEAHDAIYKVKTTSKYFVVLDFSQFDFGFGKVWYSTEDKSGTATASCKIPSSIPYNLYVYC